MSKIDSVLLIVAGGFALWQLWLCAAVYAMIRSSRHLTRAKVGIFPGIVALSLVIAVVLT